MQLSRRFRSVLALDRVSLRVGVGQIHALLGPNGAGKTTLLRIFTGLLAPSNGQVLLLGTPSTNMPRRAWTQLFGLVPSGDRSFYLRISGVENLVFFGRLHGLRHAPARRRALECLDAVGLADVADMPVNTYSHGMQKRLSVARALLVRPPVLFVDEATHDLDPEAARRVRALVTAAASSGAAVVWATQRLDEIRGFADDATVLCRGQVRFQGTVAQLMARAESRRYVVQLEDDFDVMSRARTALSGKGAIRAAGGADTHHYVMSLHQGVVLGDALAAVSAAGVRVLRCSEERSEMEEAFIRVTEGLP